MSSTTHDTRHTHPFLYTYTHLHVLNHKADTHAHSHTHTYTFTHTTQTHTVAHTYARTHTHDHVYYIHNSNLMQKKNRYKLHTYLIESNNNTGTQDHVAHLQLLVHHGVYGASANGGGQSQGPRDFELGPRGKEVQHRNVRIN